jgi:hypothetical protein
MRILVIAAVGAQLMLGSSLLSLTMAKLSLTVCLARRSTVYFSELYGRQSE